MGTTRRGFGIAATVVSVGVLAFLTYFQVQRGSPRDLAIFATATLLVVLGAGRTTRWAAVPRPDRAVLTPATVRAALAITVGAALLLVVTPRFGVVDHVVVGVIGLGCVVLAWGPDDALDDAVRAVPARRRTPVVRAAVAWLAVVVLLGVWQLVSYAPGPTISDLVDPWMDHAFGRAVFVVLWLLGLRGLVRHAWRGRHGSGATGPAEAVGPA